MKQTTEHSAGGVVFKKSTINHQSSAIFWLICKHSGYHKWVLPKGIVEEGEDPKKTGVREVLEETGVKAEIVKKIMPDVRYKYVKELPAERDSIQASRPEMIQKRKILVDKRVEFYLMKYVSGDIKNHSWEMEDVKWAATEEALKLLSFETERKTLRRAVKLLK